MKYIKLSQGKQATVSNEDFEWLNQWKWSLTSHGYAVRSQVIKRPDGGYDQKAIYMHKLINDTPEGLQTDHINGKRLDNRRSNLRSCTNSENKRNTVISKYNTSGYRGVSWSRQHKKWHTRVQVNNKCIFVGLFTGKKQAAKAYDLAAIKHHGEFASLNFRTTL